MLATHSFCYPDSAAQHCPQIRMASKWVLKASRLFVATVGFRPTASPIVDGGKAQRRPPVFENTEIRREPADQQWLLLSAATIGMRFQREHLLGDRNRGRRFALPPSTMV